MDTRAASGLGGGIFLAVVGAVLYFAVNAEVSGIEIDTIGMILMIAGGFLAGIGLISALSAGTPDSVETVREQSTDGRVVRERSEVS